MLYVGLDPGAKSALAIITHETRVITIDCSKSLREAFEHLEKLKGRNFLLALEDVHAIFGAGAKQTFNFGRSVGFWEGVLAYLGLAYSRVSPKLWQGLVTNQPLKPNMKTMSAYEKRQAKKEHRDLIKMESYRSAQNAFPTCRFPSHDVTDAVNIARYLREVHINGKMESETI